MTNTAGSHHDMWGDVFNLNLREMSLLKLSHNVFWFLVFVFLVAASVALALWIGLGAHKPGHDTVAVLMTCAAGVALLAAIWCRLQYRKEKVRLMRRHQQKRRTMLPVNPNSEAEDVWHWTNR